MFRGAAANVILPAPWDALNVPIPLCVIVFAACFPYASGTQLYQLIALRHDFYDS